LHRAAERFNASVLRQFSAAWHFSTGKKWHTPGFRSRVGTFGRP
jgi:hypothetical protein